MSKPVQIKLAEVRFTDPPAGGFSYRIPDDGVDYSAGMRVFVPFGSQRRTGFLTSIFNGEDNSQLRNILEPIDLTPPIPGDILELTRWVADYYICDWGEALAAAVPRGLKPTGRVKYKLSEAGLAEPLIAEESGPAGDLWRELRKKPLTAGQIRNRFSSGARLLDKFRKSGWIDVVAIDIRGFSPTMTFRYRWTGEISPAEALETLPERACRLRSAVEILNQNAGSVTQRKLSGIETGMSEVMRRLVKKGWVSQEQVPVNRLSSLQAGMEETAAGKPELTPDQENIVEQVRVALRSGKFRSFLLHGVTGSGKTLVYLELIEEALALGKGVIVMVPEISLTPQLTGRIHRRFGDRIMVTHSGLSDRERCDAWGTIRSGRSRVVIGPRSAVFAPVKDVGLIIVDEEHDDSYKQSDPAPRYHGRDVALYRGFKTNAVVLLGSATPDLNSYLNTQEGKSHLFELKERFGGGDMPDIWVVKFGTGSKGECISPNLQNKLRSMLEKNEQAIILVNRRGFSTIIKCPDCGEVATCPNCDISLRYHRVGKKLKCHYCGYEQRVIDICPNCKGRRLFYGGVGTQKAQRELEMLFPEARIERMDSDTTRRIGAHQEILSRFARREFDILIGTQMVAKGHDFPAVTLVGILSADQEWLRPDFRALEKAYRLLSQASGRTGRAGAGEVVIQAWDPTYPMLRWVQEHDYRKLFNEEIKSREALSYPPYGNLISITLRARERDMTERAASDFKERFMKTLPECILLGPAPPPVERVENVFRRKLLIKIPRHNRTVAQRTKTVLREIMTELKLQYRAAGVIIIVDVDPVEI